STLFAHAKVLTEEEKHKRNQNRVHVGIIVTALTNVTGGHRTLLGERWQRAPQRGARCGHRLELASVGVVVNDPGEIQWLALLPHQNRPPPHTVLALHLLLQLSLRVLVAEASIPLLLLAAEGGDEAGPAPGELPGRPRHVPGPGGHEGGDRVEQPDRHGLTYGARPGRRSDRCRQ
ncbi:unnamed protein product, partial [Musa hybrid cultivar]